MFRAAPGFRRRSLAYIQVAVVCESSTEARWTHPAVAVSVASLPHR
jgi:hypothetical protein